MTSVQQYTYWSVTINNPDENDMVIVRNPNPKYVRQFVWTMEKGENGTEHVQGWVRLQRNQAQSLVKRLYPRAHLKYISKDDYNENAYNYAQKEDETTRGHHINTMNDPVPGVDTILYKVLGEVVEKMDFLNLPGHEYPDWETIVPLHMFPLTTAKNGKEYIRKYMTWIEDRMVRGTPHLEKLFISPMYEKMYERFGPEIMWRLKHNPTNAPEVQESQDEESESEASSDAPSS